MSEIENLKIVGGSTYTVGNQDIIANAWEAGKTYVKNRSYVIQEHRLYVCNVTHTSVEPFDADNWTEITIGDAIGNNIGDLSTLTTTDKSSIVGAVNEVDGKVDEKQDKSTLRTDNFLVQNFQSSEITIPANGALNVTANTLNYTIPTGYTPIAVAGWYTGSNDTFARSIEITAQGGQSFCVLRNVGATAYTGNFQFKILFIKT